MNWFAKYGAIKFIARDKRALYGNPGEGDPS